MTPRLSESMLADMAALHRAGFDYKALAGMEWPGTKGETMRLSANQVRKLLRKTKGASECDTEVFAVESKRPR